MFLVFALPVIYLAFSVIPVLAHDEDQFHKPLGEGIGSGIWWACVTMTTVGYGDKTPKSFLGRIIAVGWMFSGIILISSLTATITTSMTFDRLYDQIGNLNDLKRHKTGVIESTSAAGFFAGQWDCP